ncbi:MAG: response regulator transcription factor [Acidobacteria bacterium]|nr:response regulator transcription factor [Acidobacteriota bacterium]MCA1619920.1 response regulator transcription factor [Acidobacteriota bacterium]
MSKLRVFLADDHMVVREGLKALVNAQPDMYVVGEADNGDAAWRAACELAADVVVMDVSMPEMSGAEATERLRRERPQVMVLALTVYEDKSYLRQMLSAGASGYVLKRAATDELVRAIRTVAAGGSYVDPTLAGSLVSSFFNQKTAEGRSPAGELSDRESQVLRLIAWGYSNKEIGWKLNISAKTVDTYKLRLMEKLNLRSRTDIVRYALQQGLLQEE